MDTITADFVPSASVIVIDPSGHRSRVELTPLPFKIGRQADNDLIFFKNILKCREYVI